MTVDAEVKLRDVLEALRHGVFAVFSPSGRSFWALKIETRIMICHNGSMAILPMPQV